MKENGMKKLIELLNESKPLEKGYEYKAKNGLVYLVYCNQLEGDEYTDYTMRIISKKFGFIKWLVDKDKIDVQNLITYMNGTSLTFNKVPSTDGADKSWNKFYTECLLMLLSISDSPIEFLISILR